MSDEPRMLHGVMEGGGAYNRYATLPAAGAALARPLLEQAARTMALDPGEGPVVIADYGSSQGKNSLAPMRVAISTLRTRLGPRRPIFVFHVDQPSNDFNSLFEVLDADPDSYVLAEPNIFPSAIGRSFYDHVLPPEHVHLGWSSYAAVWLSRIPMLLPDHFFPIRSTGSARGEFDRQGACDWEAFLTVRASELRPGGRLVVVLPGLADDGASGFEALMDHANAVLAEMVAEGAVTADERARMVVGAYPRMRRDLLAPFGPDGQFCHLTVEHCDLCALTDAAWDDYERDGDGEALAAKHARFFRSVFMPSLAVALTRSDAEARRRFADGLEHRLRRRLASNPAAMHSFVETLVLAKQDAG